MEGQKVGESVAKNTNTQNPANAPISQPEINAAQSLENQILQLLWPTALMQEIAMSRRHHEFAMPLTIINFILATLVGIALGPVQLIILALTNDYPYVTTSYAPIVQRIAMLVFGLIAVSSVIAMVRTWKEEPRRSLSISILASGTLLIGIFVWIGFLVQFQPNQIAFIMTLIIAATIIAAIIASKQFLNPDKPRLPLHVTAGCLIAIGAIEGIFTGAFLFSQSNQAKEAELEIIQLGQAQADARLDGVTNELSDLTYTLCAGPYDIIYLPTTVSDTGLFECRGTHELFAVSGPNEPITDTSVVITGAAFYFGRTVDDMVNTYFPSTLGIKYIYRNLPPSINIDNNPSELVILAPAATEEVLVNTFVEPLHDFLSNRTDTNDLLFSLFYNNEVNNVITTKDYILLAAADTIAMNSDLPNGTTLKGYLNGKYGTYIYTPELQLQALVELGLNPLLYSSQTREAINSHPHITVLLEGGREYTLDELRELLYASFINPNSGENSDNSTPENPDAE